MKQDLTQGSIPKHLLSLALPTSFGFMAQTLYDLVDMAWIGKINQNAVAGVTIFSFVFWTVEVLNEVVGASSVSLISQSHGAKDIERTERVIEQTLVFKAFLACIAATLLLLFLRPLLGFFNKDTDVLRYALDYGYLRVFFLPILFSSFTVNTALRCTGDARSPMFIMTFSSVLNIILDPFLIFETIPGTQLPGLGMGVFGAALATVISSSLAFLIGFYLLFSGRAAVRPRLRGLFTLDWKIDIKLLTIGAPVGLDAFARNFSTLVILKFTQSFGTSTQAALGIGHRLMHIVLLPLIGLLLGGSTLVGQNLGAEKVDRAVKTARWSVLYAGAAMSLITTSFLLSAPMIMGLFIREIEVIEIGTSMIKISSLGFIPLGIAFGMGVVFPGAGDNFPLFISSSVGKWGVQIPFLFIATHRFPETVELLWLSFILANLTEAFVVAIFFKLGRWKRVRV